MLTLLVRDAGLGVLGLDFVSCFLFDLQAVNFSEIHVFYKKQFQCQWP